MGEDRILKNIIIIFFPLLMIVGCSEPINVNSLVKRNGIAYKVNSEKPFTGESFELDKNGIERWKCNFKNGKKHGNYILLYKNGQKKIEGKYKNNVRVGIWKTWYKNGQQKSIITFKDGEKIIRKEWNEKGQLLKND